MVQLLSLPSLISEDEMLYWRIGEDCRHFDLRLLQMTFDLLKDAGYRFRSPMVHYLEEAKSDSSYERYFVWWDLE
jgi:hypothetical protein